MTRTKTTLKIVPDETAARTIAGHDIPATMPILMSSNAQAMAWARERDEALSEIDLIDEQIASAQRMCRAAIEEGERVFDARLAAAHKARVRVEEDADKIAAATIEGCRRRQDDVRATVAGFEAAIAAVRTMPAGE